MLSLLYVLFGLVGGYGILRFFQVKETLNTLLNNSNTTNKILDLETKRRNLQAQETLEEMKRQYFAQEQQKGKDVPVSSDDFNPKPPTT